MSEDGRIYDKHRAELIRYATALVGPSEAEDIVSIVVLRTIRRRQLSEIENPRAYLMKGVLNESRGWRRRHRPSPLPDDLRSNAPVETLDTVQALWKLPPRQRAVVYLFYWELARIGEIAELMGVGSGTVKRYLYLARLKLQKELS